MINPISNPPAISNAPASHSGLTIGIVGGVGSGKSAVANATCEELNRRGILCEVLDGDRVGHQTLTVPEVVESIAAAFGSGVIEAGQVSRKALAGKVFGEEAEQQANRARLEAIMHPAMRATFQDRIANAVANKRVVLFDAAVLFESGWDDLCNGCVFVDVPETERQTRAMTRGWTADRWQHTEASQWPLDRKRAAAEAFGSRSLVIENTRLIGEVASDVANWICDLAGGDGQEGMIEQFTPPTNEAVADSC